MYCAKGSVQPLSPGQLLRDDHPLALPAVEVQTAPESRELTLKRSALDSCAVICVSVCFRAGGLLRERAGSEQASTGSGARAGVAGLRCPPPLLLAQHIVNKEDHAHRPQAVLHTHTVTDDEGYVRIHRELH